MRWVQQGFELQFVQFRHCNSTGVHACIVLMKEHLLHCQTPRCEFRSAARVGPSGHGWPYSSDHSWANCGSFGFTNFGSQHRQPKMCPTVGSTMAQTRTDCRANFGELLQMTVTVSSAHLWATVKPIVSILITRFR